MAFRERLLHELEGVNVCIFQSEPEPYHFSLYGTHIGALIPTNFLADGVAKELNDVVPRVPIDALALRIQDLHAHATRG